MRTAVGRMTDDAGRATGAAWLRRVVTTVDDWPSGIVLLAARLWMAEIFFRSGWLKIQDMGSAEFLFSEVHPVPFLPPLLAAWLAVAVELGASTLLALGLLARLAALPMLAMALVIQFVVGLQDPGFYQQEHYYWMFLFLFVITLGAGRLSLDHGVLTPRLAAR